VTWLEVRDALDALDRRCAQLMQAEGIASERCQVAYSADVCYIGQSYHLEIALSPATADPLAVLYQAFRAMHDRVYGHGADAPARIVNLRTIHRSAVPKSRSATYAPSGRSDKAPRRILTADSGGFINADIYDRRSLAPGVRFTGPAIVEQGDTTTLIEPGWRAEVARNGTLVLSPS
jgi:N-methylhydantoinase A/oxoprolinase/acetone carboxylase beta subunit